PATMDGLVDGDPLVITREVVLPVTMTLVARTGTTIAGVRSLASHPHALAQSARWIAEHLPQVVPLPTTSTAAAAAAVPTGGFDLRFLGSYPRADDRTNRPVPQLADDAAFADAESWLARVRAGLVS